MHNETERTKVSGKHSDLARKAAIQAAPKTSVGDFIEAFEDGENLVTYIFESKQKGYVGWRWSVTVFANGSEATVSEVVLIPGPESLVAPEWVPWSERLADYKALQAELEAQAALAAEDDVDEVEDESEEVSAALDDEPADDAEDDAEETGKKPRFSRARKLFGIKKVRGKGKKPKD
ncbi:MAG: DUF3027 domain-containing protein [Rhodoluna sp.]